ncbi:helicase HerA-like domain-containing protein [Haliea sp. E17]|uniref:helicase HerA-like domain-containing protein n=1 Tax=Haliea sp. E17 TaxID=3401576 RepID=UPI003AAE31B7
MSILIGGNDNGQVFLNPRYANRHGLVAGATGTGKTVTLQCLAEGFSDIGVPVFLADVKGDLSGLCQPGSPHPKIDERVAKIGIAGFQQKGYPVSFWDLFGKQGVPVRSTVSEMGPQLLSRLLDLNESQESVLTLVFEFTDKEGLLLLDLADLRTSLEFLAENSSSLSTGYSVSKASVNAILRRLLMLEREGGSHFFGEPALELQDFMQKDRQGRGVINVLAADSLIMQPRVYSTFLLWLLSELFETLPEIGDPEQPVLVFFFDEAHLLFSGASRALLEKIEQVVRLIRSKGVGVYFVTQSPSDIPDSVLAQLGNRVQHALRAYTPKEQKAVKVAAQSFRENPGLDTVTAIGELGVGEALVSTLQEKGIPAPVERVLVRPPHSRMGQATPEERKLLLDNDPNLRRYGQAVDPRSAHEVLGERTRKLQEQQDAAELEKRARKAGSGGSRRSNRQGIGEAFLKSFARSLGSASGQKLLRGILGSLLK